MDNDKGILRNIMNCSHSGAAMEKGQAMMRVSSDLFCASCFIFYITLRGYFPPGFRRPRSFISSENCSPGFQSLAARYDKTQYQENVCFLSAIFFQGINKRSV